jgi:hypothetical protein
MQTSGFEIFDMLARAQLTGQAIYIAAKLRIADHLKDGAKSVEQLAEWTETHPDSLYRLLRMLASIGIFAEIKEEDDKQEQANQKIRRRFELTPMASLIQSDTKNSIRNFALMFGLESFKKAIDDLLYSIQTGENSFKHANGMEMYEHFEQNQQEAQIFNGAMASLTSSHASLILSMYDFSQFNTIIDIGGGQGMFLSTILKNNPNVHGILFDLPHAIESAKKLANVKDNNVNDVFSRCTLIEGDFFKSIPSVGADGYIIKNAILNWDDESAAIILKNCLQAIKGTSSPSQSPSVINKNQANRKKVSPKLLIIDTIMPEGNEPFIGKFTDILMLALTHKGRIRTEAEFRKLLDGCGFEIADIIRSHDPANFLSIIEAIAS